MPSEAIQYCPIYFTYDFDCGAFVVPPVVYLLLLQETLHANAQLIRYIVEIDSLSNIPIYRIVVIICQHKGNGEFPVHSVTSERDNNETIVNTPPIRLCRSDLVLCPPVLGYYA